jgi:sigma-B regulation protein RsbU (phosphoserine phosphatase)
VRKRLGTVISKLRNTANRLREWLRRVMPRVLIVAVSLFVLRLLPISRWLFSHPVFGTILSIITFCALGFSILYFAFKGLRWLKRRLLWRVRRRLIVTYLFVGLTPIVLLVMLGLLSGFGGSSEAMSQNILSQMNATERLTQTSTRALADGFARLPANTDERTAQEWLDERAMLLRSSLPGARIAAWRSAAGDDTSTGRRNAPYVSEVADEATKGVGDSSTPMNAPLPEWLNGQDEWHGLTLVLPADENERFATPAVRAMARSTSDGRQATVLVMVPMSRALIEEYRKQTGINVRPYFLKEALRRRGSEVEIGSAESRSRAARRAETNRSEGVPPFRRDQFGDPINSTVYLVVGPATDWVTGKSDPHLLFFFDWTWTSASKQFLGSSEIGRAWQQALKIIAIVFLVLELLALFAAAWMTRAVTGTVHKLYRAVEFIKRGDFSHRVHAKSQDQLGELAAAFNEMSSNIESLLKERVEHERLEREVEIAAEVQARLFPGAVPDLTSVQVAAECRAARGVAGDYYDYVEVVPGLVALALGDVSGKGVSAALVMSNLQATIRAQAAIIAERLSIAERAVAVSVGGDGDRVLARVMADADMDGAVARNMTNINKQLCQSTEANRFATLFLALFEDRGRTLRYSNAGHNAALLVRSGGSAEKLTAGGMLAGAFDWAQYEEATTTLEPGDVLLIFSDGLSEAENNAGEEYGDDRIAVFVIEHRHLSADELRRALFEEIDRWSGEREIADDQTLLILKAND